MGGVSSVQGLGPRVWRASLLAVSDQSEISHSLQWLKLEPQALLSLGPLSELGLILSQSLVSQLLPVLLSLLEIRGCEVCGLPRLGAIVSERWQRGPGA